MDLDQLLTAPTVDAAVAALATRNAHHLEGMDATEREQAVAHWRELAVDVLTAARAAAAGTPQAAPDAQFQGGRAVVVFEDAGEEDVSIHVAFHPELQDLGNGEVAGSPAQITAMAVLQDLTGEGEEAG